MDDVQANGAAIRRLNTVVFVDIVGSTELSATLGDEAWAELLERYQAVVRAALANTGGEEMDTAGDGFFAVFADPAAALAFGCSVGSLVETLGLRVRVGAHTGTCWIAGEKCSGLTVSIAARIVAHADPDDVLVSAAVRERLAGDARFDFREHGEAALKGVPGSWTLYAASGPRSSSAARARVRPVISSRTRRTSSSGRPAGSVSSQST